MYHWQLSVMTRLLVLQLTDPTEHNQCIIDSCLSWLDCWSSNSLILQNTTNVSLTAVCHDSTVGPPTHWSYRTQPTHHWQLSVMTRLLILQLTDPTEPNQCIIDSCLSWLDCWSSNSLILQNTTNGSLTAVCHDSTVGPPTHWSYRTQPMYHWQLSVMTRLLVLQLTDPTEHNQCIIDSCLSWLDCWSSNSLILQNTTNASLTVVCHDSTVDPPTHWSYRTQPMHHWQLSVVTQLLILQLTDRTEHNQCIIDSCLSWLDCWSSNSLILQNTTNASLTAVCHDSTVGPPTHWSYRTQPTHHWQLSVMTRLLILQLTDRTEHNQCIIDSCLSWLDCWSSNSLILQNTTNVSLTAVCHDSTVDPPTHWSYRTQPMYHWQLSVMTRLLVLQLTDPTEHNQCIIDSCLSWLDCWSSNSLILQNTTNASLTAVCHDSTVGPPTHWSYRTQPMHHWQLSVMTRLLVLQLTDPTEHNQCIIDSCLSLLDSWSSNSLILQNTTNASLTAVCHDSTVGPPTHRSYRTQPMHHWQLFVMTQLLVLQLTDPTEHNQCIIDSCLSWLDCWSSNSLILQNTTNASLTVVCHDSTVDPPTHWSYRTQPMHHWQLSVVTQLLILQLTDRTEHNQCIIDSCLSWLDCWSSNSLILQNTTNASLTAVCHDSTVGPPTHWSYRTQPTHHWQLSVMTRLLILQLTDRTEHNQCIIDSCLSWLDCWSSNSLILQNTTNVSLTAVCHDSTVDPPTHWSYRTQPMYHWQLSVMTRLLVLQLTDPTEHNQCIIDSCLSWLDCWSSNSLILQNTTNASLTAVCHDSTVGPPTHWSYRTQPMHHWQLSVMTRLLVLQLTDPTEHNQCIIDSCLSLLDSWSSNSLILQNTTNASLTAVCHDSTVGPPTHRSYRTQPMHHWQLFVMTQLLVLQLTDPTEHNQCIIDSCLSWLDCWSSNSLILQNTTNASLTAVCHDSTVGPPTHWSYRTQPMYHWQLSVMTRLLVLQLTDPTEHNQCIIDSCLSWLDCWSSNSLILQNTTNASLTAVCHDSTVGPPTHWSYRTQPMHHWQLSVVTQLLILQLTDPTEHNQCIIDSCLSWLDCWYSNSLILQNTTNASLTAICHDSIVDLPTHWSYRTQPMHHWQLSVMTRLLILQLTDPTEHNQRIIDSCLSWLDCWSSNSLILQNTTNASLTAVCHDSTVDPPTHWSYRTQPMHHWQLSVMTRLLILQLTDPTEHNQRIIDSCLSWLDCWSSNSLILQNTTNASLTPVCHDSTVDPPTHWSYRTQPMHHWQLSVKTRLLILQLTDPTEHNQYINDSCLSWLDCWSSNSLIVHNTTNGSLTEHNQRIIDSCLSWLDCWSSNSLILQNTTNASLTPVCHDSTVDPPTHWSYRTQPMHHWQLSVKTRLLILQLTDPTEHNQYINDSCLSWLDCWSSNSLIVHNTTNGSLTAVCHDSTVGPPTHWSYRTQQTDHWQLSVMTRLLILQLTDPTEHNQRIIDSYLSWLNCWSSNSLILQNTTNASLTAVCHDSTVDTPTHWSYRSQPMHHSQSSSLPFLDFFLDILADIIYFYQIMSPTTLYKEYIER